ncbi:MAG: ATP-binding protein [Sandaracinaceae bacterium]
MIGSLRARLLSSMLAVMGVVMLTTWLAGTSFLEARVRGDAQGRLEWVAASTADLLVAGASPEELARSVALQHGMLVGIFDASGQVLASTHPDARRAVVGLDRPVDAEVIEDPSGDRSLHVVRTLDDGRRVRLVRSLTPAREARTALRQVLGVAGLVTLLMALLLTEYLTRAIGGPIQRMTQTADALRRGDFSNRVRSRRRDELGALGAAIDQMADQLVERFEAARREEARLRTILDAMIEAVLVTDAWGRIVLTNAALDEIAGRHVLDHTAVEAIRSAELHDAVRKGLGGETSEVAFDITTDAGRRTFWAQVTPLPRTGHDHGGVVAVLHDVTELKRADAIRRDFVANASHELRTPLTAIVGFSETLLDGALEDERMGRRFVANIADNAVRLKRLVDDLLELSRAESPEAGYELGPVDVSQAALNVLRGLERRAAEKQQELRLDAEEPIFAYADPQALDQVLLNLVDNAIKYTPEHGQIAVRVREIGRKTLIEVIDDGPGIPRAQQDRIFERFYRVDRGRARRDGGTGLGLSIVRHLVGRLGGEITVDSRVGRGTTFRVRLSRADAPTAAPQPALLAERGSA